MSHLEPIRDGFTFYRSFYESVSECSLEEQRELYGSVIEYALLGKEPSIENKYIKGIFSLIKPNIDSSIRKYDQRKEARKGKTKQERNRNETETKPYNNNKNKNTIKIKNNNPKENKQLLYDGLPSVLASSLRDFEDMRKKIKKPLTNRARETIIRKLQEYSDGDLNLMIEILNQSIVNCWSNVYPLREINGSQKKNVSSMDLMEMYKGKE